MFSSMVLFQINEDGNKCSHPGRDLLYEFHSNQSGDDDNVLVHVLGHWRLTALFHDLVFHPKVVVCLKFKLLSNFVIYRILVRSVFHFFMYR